MPRTVALCAGLALIVACAATVAIAAPRQLAGLELDNGTVYTLSARAKLDRQRRAQFRIAVDEVDAGDYEPGGTVETAKVRLAGARLIVVGSSVDCSRPGASLVYGTALRRVRRVEVTLRGGRRLRLRRRAAPTAWRFNGWVVGAIYRGRRPARSIRAYDADGRRLAFARFTGASGCGRG